MIPICCRPANWNSDIAYYMILIFPMCASLEAQRKLRRDARDDFMDEQVVKPKAKAKAKAKAKGKAKAKAKLTAESGSAPVEEALRNERVQDAPEERDEEAVLLENEEEEAKNDLRAEPPKKRGRAKRKATVAKDKEDDVKEASPLPVRRRLSFGVKSESEADGLDPDLFWACVHV